MAFLVTRGSSSMLLNRTLRFTSPSSFISSPRAVSGIFLRKTQLFPSAPDSIQNQNRVNASGAGYASLNDPSPNWSNRPPKETILLDGCDYEHWLIVMEFPKDARPSEEEMISSYVRTLASVLGSEDEATKKIYSVCTTTYTGFGALISEELSYKVKELPGVLWVLPDSYMDVPNKDYGGDLFVDGKVIRRPEFTQIGLQRTRSRPRPRYDRRRETIQVERRAPMVGQSWRHDQSQPMHQQQQPQPPAIDQSEHSRGFATDFSINPSTTTRGSS